MDNVNEGNSDDSGGVIILSVAAFAFIVIALIVIFLLFRKKKSPSPEADTSSNTKPSTSSSPSPSTVIIRDPPPPSPPDTRELTDSEKAIVILTDVFKTGAITESIRLGLYTAAELANLLIRGVQKLPVGATESMRASRSTAGRIASLARRWPFTSSSLATALVKSGVPLEKLIKRGMFPFNSISSMLTGTTAEAFMAIATKQMRSLAANGAMTAAQMTEFEALVARNQAAAASQRAITGATRAAATSAVAAADAALMAITLVNFIGEFAAKKLVETKFTGDFLIMKANSDAQYDNDIWQETGKWPVYKGPLDISAEGEWTEDLLAEAILTEVVVFMTYQIQLYISSATGTNPQEVDPVVKFFLDSFVQPDGIIGSGRTCPSPEPHGFIDLGAPSTDISPVTPIDTSFISNIPGTRVTPAQASAAIDGYHTIIKTIPDCVLAYLHIIARNNLCISSGGTVAEGKYCSFKKADCKKDPHSIWPIADATGTQDSFYIEWREKGLYDKMYPGKHVNGKQKDTKVLSSTGAINVQAEPEGFCLLRDPALRQRCQTGITPSGKIVRNKYISDTGLCVNTPAVCGRDGYGYNYNEQNPISKMGGNHGVTLYGTDEQYLPACTVSRNRKIVNEIFGGSFLGQVANTYGKRFINKLGPALGSSIANNQLIQNAMPGVSSAITLMLDNPKATKEGGDAIGNAIVNALDPHRNGFCTNQNNPFYWMCG